MTFNIDTKACKKPFTDEERIICDTIAFQLLAIGIDDLTPKTAPEVYARIHFIEQYDGAILKKTNENGEPTPRPITPADVRRFIGLTTNSDKRTRAQFLKGFERDLNRHAREYNEQDT